jgi:pimeloyl-ACP methyl ester carboxylesterase
MKRGYKMKVAKAIDDSEVPPGNDLFLSRLRWPITKDTLARLQALGKNTARFLTNELIARWVNVTYNSYSRFYEGQLRLGLPVSRELIKTQEEIRAIAAGKLALTLYHIILRVTGIRISRNEIKYILIAELEAGNLRLTENVIVLTRKQLKTLIINRFKIPAYFFTGIFEEAGSRRILKETLKEQRLPSYFDSEIEENTHIGRRDYEIVYYRDYTEEGKEIKFRRLVSIEDVTSGDNRPAVILVPGFANNSNCYDLSVRQSMARDMADSGFWVYLFDPRGMGINKGKFDPLYTVDTLIDFDLPTVLNFVHSRSRNKPAVLVGHSMGGIIAENMVLNWNMRKHLNSFQDLTSEQKAYMNQILPPPHEAEENLRQVRAIISLGSPKFFNKMTHAFFPTVLWMNHLSRIFRLQHLPVKDALQFLMRIPVVSDVTQLVLNSDFGDLNFLMNPENHKGNKIFTKIYVDRALESVPLGLGFQFLKAIYNGEGFKRMDQSRFNYSSHLNYFPKDIPIFHFWGSKDPLAPPDNLQYSRHYPHGIKKIYHLESPKDAEKIEITDRRSQVIDFIVEGANHLDLLYGKQAEEIVYPLVMRIINETWGDWSYETASAIDAAEMAN